MNNNNIAECVPYAKCLIILRTGEVNGEAGIFKISETLICLPYFSDVRLVTDTGMVLN